MIQVVPPPFVTMVAPPVGWPGPIFAATSHTVTVGQEMALSVSGAAGIVWVDHTAPPSVVANTRVRHPKRLPS